MYSVRVRLLILITPISSEIGGQESTAQSGQFPRHALD